MAIFDRYQIAHDIARFVNIIHDGIDACKHVANGVDPDSGAEIAIPDGHTPLAYKQQVIRNWSNAALTNYAALAAYIGRVGLAEAQAAVQAIYGVDATAVQAEIQNLRDVAQYIYNNVLLLTTEDQLKTGAAYISTRVSQWKSIRRRWAL